MARIFYVHWHKDEALKTVRALRAAGHTVAYHWSSGEESWRLLKDAPPDALVISLDRLPSHGRSVAAVLDESKRLRGLPLIFVGGKPEKVAATRNRFPSAAYCTDHELLRVLSRIGPFVPATTARAIRPRAATMARNSAAGYSGTPLPQKLGFKPNARIAILNAPAGFRDRLGALPPGVRPATRLARLPADVIVFFTRSRHELARKFSSLAARLNPAGGLWVSWPKKASGVVTNLTEDVVREIGLAAGLVDNKVCAVDSTWSGLRFVFRTSTRPAQ